MQLNRRPGARTAYLTLRDPDVDMSPVGRRSRSTPSTRCRRPLGEGARVVLQAKPVFWTQRGSLMLDARQIRPVGVGELLARLEHLKRTLAAEGLFDADRKRPLPFLPRTGRAGLRPGQRRREGRRRERPAPLAAPCASRSARSRCRAPTAVTEVTRRARRSSTPTPSVDVIVIARGGGAVEDLLPFSNETLVRAVAAARTPVVSAIGHDVDTPLLDLVADWRASTPTDAGKRVVPDAAERARTRVRQAARPRPARRCRPGRRRAAAPASRSARARSWPTRPPSSRARREELDALQPPRPAPRHGRGAPRRRPGRAPARAGAHPLPAVDARARAMPWCSTPTAASSWTRPTSRSASCCGCGSPAGDFAVRVAGAALGWDACRSAPRTPTAPRTPGLP